MRNSTSGSTSETSTVQDESSNNAEKTSAKKLKQARLPFKIIAADTSPLVSKTTTLPAVEDKDKDSIEEGHSKEVKKRKLSYDTDEDGTNVDKMEDNVSKENVQKTVAAKKKKPAASNTETITEIVVSILDDDNKNDEGNIDEAVNPVCSTVDKKGLNLKNCKATLKDIRKGAGTPQTCSQKNKTGCGTKLQIKLPLSSGKKRRKINHQLTHKICASELPVNDITQETSSDDIEEIALELNPQKRKKLNNETNKLETKNTVDQEQKLETIDLDSEPEKEGEDKPLETEKLAKAVIGKKEIRNNATKIFVEQCNKKKDIDENNKQDVNEELTKTVLKDNDNKLGIESDNSSEISFNVSYDAATNSESKLNNTILSQTEDNNSVSISKNLTPKQVKLMEQRRRAREVKEGKLLEEKLKKQQEKKEKEMVKKREREEKEEQKRKEREEKEEQKRKEREEKDRKRLAEIEAKNEEKRKKNEAKEGELRKKEEERKRKEQEKEEAELKKKKAAQAFTKFFVAKTPTSIQIKNEEDSNTGDGTKLLAFRPFQIKGDMKLAPICRKNFTAEEKKSLDDILGYNKIDVEENGIKGEQTVQHKPLLESELYLSKLRSGNILPGKWRRASTESKDDVVLVEDELERVGQEIIEDIPSYVRDEMRVKFYKFHDNRRPPYYGTWRKKSSIVKPRKPFARDMGFFDYEIDSDDEWEEEEPGESLEDSDEDKERESEDDEYEVDNDWFVPHGHLSDEELQNEDEFGSADSNTREAQKAKLQLLQQEFAQEMKKKTEKIKPRLIGCIWADIHGNQPRECAKILWDTLEKKAMIFIEHPLIEEPESERSSESNSPSGAINSNIEKPTDKLKPISLSDNMVKDLTRLIHGNNHAKNFLINEYIAYIEKTEESVKNGGLRKPLKSVVRDKIDEIAEWQAVDVTALSIKGMEQTNVEANDKKKKKVKRRLCWVVKQEILNKMNLSSLELRNSWKYTLPPKFVKVDKDVKRNDVAGTSETVFNSLENGAKEKHSEIPQITTEEKATKSQQKFPSSTEISTTDRSSTEKKLNVPATPKEKKRVSLLMSVARGQQISTPLKNKLISQFLQQSKDSAKPSFVKTSSCSNSATSPNVDGDVVILD